MPAIALKYRVFQTASSLQAFVTGNYNAYPSGPALDANDTTTVSSIVSITFDSSSGTYTLWFL
jgi:hypothetical protein